MKKIIQELRRELQQESIHSQRLVRDIVRERQEQNSEQATYVTNNSKRENIAVKRLFQEAFQRNRKKKEAQQRDFTQQFRVQCALVTYTEKQFVRPEVHEIKASLEAIDKMIPRGIDLYDTSKANGSYSYQAWYDAQGYQWNIHFHGPHPNAEPRYNSGKYWTIRIQRTKGLHAELMGLDGMWYPTSQAQPRRSDSQARLIEMTHIPMKTPQQEELSTILEERNTYARNHPPPPEASDPSDPPPESFDWAVDPGPSLW